MNDFRAKFVKESIKHLKTLQENSTEDFSENLRRDFFRIVHSTKGLAQTFGLINAAKLANELENLLSRQEITENETLQISLFEGINLLVSALRETNYEIPSQFIEKLQNNNFQIPSQTRILIANLPHTIFRQLSESEKNALIESLAAAKTIFSINVSFEKTDFAEDYRNFRDFLNESGEIIAALSDLKLISSGKISFQILYSANETIEDLSKKIKVFQVRIATFSRIENSSNSPAELFLTISEHAQSFGKNIGFIVLANDVSLSFSTKTIIFDILLQLVRNAVDHAFEKHGELKIFLFAEDNTLFLSVSDNGKGIDLDKVKQRAIEKNLILSDDTLNEQHTLELIFASEVSTAEKISEISGRGVGLEIVKSSVEKLNGKISVESRKDFGTKFEIILPLEKI
jgi:chemotaxis protein histidine kinase CheA